MKVLHEDYVDRVCKFGQGAKACSFLLAGESGHQCAKESPVLNRTILGMRAEMKAKGDNCSGPQNFGPVVEQQFVELTPEQVRCKTCGDVYIPSPRRDYYNGTNNIDGQCGSCAGCMF